MSTEHLLEHYPSIADDLRAAIARLGHTRVYPARAIVIHEGDVGDLLYLIVDGSVKVYSTNEAGKVIVYGHLGPGELLGEPTLDGGVRSASVMTLEKTTCLTIRAGDFRAIIAANPSLAMDVIFKLIRLLRASNAHVRSLALDDVYGRVVGLLMDSAIPDGDRWVIHQKMTQQDLAEHVGASREMVGRILKDLEKGGYLVVDRDTIRIEKKPPPGW